MRSNAGILDRVLRLIIGLLLISLVFVGPRSPWGWLGLIAIATGLVGWCPLYSLLGMNSCSGATPK